jgi:hypothetical protein
VCNIEKDVWLAHIKHLQFLLSLCRFSDDTGILKGQIMQGKENKHVVYFKNGKLKQGEQVELHLEGWIGEMMGKGKDTQRNGQLVVTNERVCFFRKGMLGEVLETIPLSKITSIETLSRLGYRVIRLHTSHDELAFKTFESKELFDKVHDRIEELRHKPIQTMMSSPRGASDDIYEKIRKLNELSEAGILTKEEYEAKKTSLLAQI